MNPRPGAALPYGRHAIDEDDIAAVTAVLRGDWLTSGPAGAAFEAALAERCHAAHAVSCANGTAALHLACLALGLGPGDAAIVPAITFVATANAARMTGAEIVFADVDPESGLMEVHHLAAALELAERRGLIPRLVLPVDLAGQCADLTAIADFARSRDLAIVEDACHAIGTIQIDAGGHAAPVGACTSSDMTVFSFHPVKTVAAGEGGAILTQSDALADRLRRLRSHGITRDAAAFEDRQAGFDRAVANPWYYEMLELGFNYRVSDINCALALSQIKKLDRFVAARRMLAARYDSELASLAPLLRPAARSPHSIAAWHIYSVLINFDAIGMSRGQLARALEAQNIRTQVHYIPVPRQPYYRHRYGDAELPGADAYYRRTLTLPLFVGMTDDDVGRVAEALSHLLLDRDQMPLQRGSLS